jgi:hypothetical protein
MRTTTRHECIEKIRHHTEAASARLDAMVEITAGVPPEDLTEPDASRGLSFIVAAAQAHAETARAWAALHEVMFGGTG